ncbi:MAG: molybdopterin molybdotransferase MoeA [bacterium]
MRGGERIPASATWVELEEAQHRAVRAAEELPGRGVEEVGLEEVLHRWLADPAAADADQPPFDRAMMDGYALRSGDAAGASQEEPVRLPVRGRAAAGTPGSLRLEEGTALQIFTGAPVPPGADTVVPVERTRREGDEVLLLGPVDAGDHIGRRGTQVREGERLLPAGVCVDPSRSALLASVGAVPVRVGRMPRLVVAATGDELVSPDRVPGPGRIRETSTFMLGALFASRGFTARRVPRIADEVEAVRKGIRDGAAGADVLCLTGGVSMGEKDYVEGVLEELGAEVLFRSVKIKPGKPMVAARLDRSLVFGLPGNPVSSFVTAHQVVLPALRAFAGAARPLPRFLPARLAGTLRTRGPRPEFRPVRCSGGREGLQVSPVDYRGSSDIAGLARGNALVSLPGGDRELERGSIVDVCFYRGCEGVETP